MASWAEPGAKCVCVDASPCSWSGRPSGLIVGEVYTVVAQLPMDRTGGIGVRINEVPSASELRGGKYGWAISRFRPLVTQSDDVAKFTHLLKPTKQTESA